MWNLEDAKSSLDSETEDTYAQGDVLGSWSAKTFSGSSWLPLDGVDGMEDSNNLAKPIKPLASPG